jgi:CoA:oxalate CoA-transferase
LRWPPGRPIFGPIATADGWINLSIASERTFRSLAAASGHPHWLSDPRFAEYASRRANWGELIEELEGWSTERTTREVQAIFDRHGVPSSPYRTVKEAMADPQIAHRQGLAEVRDAGGAFQARSSST